MKWFKKRKKESEMMKYINKILSRPKKGNPHRHEKRADSS